MHSITSFVGHIAGHFLIIMYQVIFSLEDGGYSRARFSLSLQFIVYRAPLECLINRL